MTSQWSFLIRWDSLPGCHLDVPTGCRQLTVVPVTLQLALAAKLTAKLEDAAALP